MIFIPTSISSVADRRLEDESAGEEAAGATGKAWGSPRQGPPRIAEKDAESGSRSVGVHQPHRCRLISSIRAHEKLCSCLLRT